MADGSSAAATPALVAVLAGGLGRRLGGAKALVELGGRTLISYPLQAACEAGLETVIVAKRASELPPTPSASVVLEPDRPRHPLCGIVAALRHAQRPVVAVGCDMPFLTAALLRWFASRTGASAIAQVGGELQPFPALYSHARLDLIEQALAAERPLRATLTTLQAHVLAEDELRLFGDPHRLCFSVNDERDLDTARAWMRAAGSHAG